MDSNNETNGKRIILGRTKSCDGGTLKAKSEVTKRKFSVNEAVKSLDFALSKLKRAKPTLEGYSSDATDTTTSVLRYAADMFIDSTGQKLIHQSIDNASLMSMNFSHYELVRNVSRSNCHSDEAHSGTTCNTSFSSEDLAMKGECLERYFRSVEMWRNRNELARMRL